MAEYIDRKAAIKELAFDYAYAAADLIKKIPAADVQEVRYGNWFNNGSLSCRCSECGCKSNRESNFCPYCGAKMDKE